MATEETVDIEQELHEITFGICNELSVLEVLAQAIGTDELADQQLLLKRAIATLAGRQSRIEVVQVRLSAPA